jgi:hypothetical protein
MLTLDLAKHNMDFSSQFISPLLSYVRVLVAIPNFVDNLDDLLC